MWRSFQAGNLKELEIIDAIIEEPLGGAHRDPQTAADNLERWVARALRDLKRLKPETLLRRRYERLRNLGAFFTAAREPKTPKSAKSRGKRSQAAGRTVHAAPAGA